jgi:hypothetical protein
MRVSDLSTVFGQVTAEAGFGAAAETLEMEFIEFGTTVTNAVHKVIVSMRLRRDVVVDAIAAS